ncbi:MAG: hypothetical protein A2538_00420 [Candidatus Magasanikbacteria bacterium RIFOXYD2_FULL_41_14]|uniref:DUF4935 domain-containing protein n=1 Tax=Candidatus Magasanikbacteria bacterium RIFOXYD2_FULL_41_14 TaxID=1798709 RepID=A0A1F6PEL9_9BACT|nr:MAG: hypothetical protein A2538_00420 [Candidatus Magasanikbacteria bacterium RIFOXYD2_FULL_41_14]
MLKNLINLIEKEKLELILPKQIEDEFIRNKNSSNIYHDHILNFGEGLGVTLKTPNLLTFSQKINQIKSTVKKLNSLKERAVTDYKNRVFNPKSRINRSLNKLFSLATRPEESDTLLQKAWFRNLRGNPPRKNNASFGDAIIWETIIQNFVDEDLFLISGDGDFESDIKNGKINELLMFEWSNKTENKITLYKELGSFINEKSKNRKKLPIAQNIIKDEEILNSTYITDYPLSIGSNMGVTKNASDIGWKDVLNQTYAYTLKSYCSCCGVEADSSITNSIMFGGDKCQNCSETYSVGQTCGKCRKHFHRNMLTYNGIINNYYCNECQNVTI